jgi:alpha-L-fucosidase
MRQLARVLMLLLIMPVAATAAAPAANDPLTSARTQWWREARFGLFIHWGVYAVPGGAYNGKEVSGGGEWIMNTGHIPVAEYEKFASQFNPTKFDARAWVKAAKGAGMKYIVITAKHHDGFSMFDTKLTPYNVVAATPWHHDPMKDLAEACRAEGIRLCFYYSILDWHHPDQQKDFPKYVEYMKGQLKELLTQYGPIGVLWFDGQWIPQWTPEQGRDLEKYVRSLQPDIIINNRVGKGGRTDGDYETPEQTIPAGAIKGRLWETCMTLNDTWGYKTSDKNWKTSTDLTRKLIDIASKGGNFLLNVGPTAEGEIPQPSLDRLAEVGKWMKTNGDAIYGTTASPWRKTPFDGRATVKGDTLYLHVFNWDKVTGQLPLQEDFFVGSEFLDASVQQKPAPNIMVWFPGGILSDGRTVWSVTVPDHPDPIATVVSQRFGAPVSKLGWTNDTISQAADGSIILLAVDAGIHGDTAQYESGDGKDNIGYWTDAKDWVSWDMLVKKPGTFSVAITYACGKGAGGSEIIIGAGDQEVAAKVKDTGDWTKFVTENLGTLKIEKAGRTTVSVKVKSKPGFAVMNLRSVELRPAKE